MRRLFLQIFIISVVFGSTLLFLLSLGSSVAKAESPKSVEMALVPNDPDFFRQWYLPHIKLPRAWEYSQGSHEVVVAVLDTGIDIDHPDLRDNIWVNKAEKPYDQTDNDGNGYVDDFYGWNFVDNSNIVKPDLSSADSTAANHGTVIAGVIGARGANGVGVAGLNWQIKIMSLKVLDNNGHGDTQRVASAIHYAIDKGVDVINLSFVGNEYDPVLQGAIDRAWQNNIVIVAAAGNEGDVGHDFAVTLSYPVCNDGIDNKVIGVVAVDQFNHLAQFSNYGTKCSDVTAPGVGFFSTVVNEPGFGQYTDLYSGGWSGTSVATPVVSGVAALIKAKNPALSAVQIRNIIINSSDSIDSVNNADVRGKIGQGLINAEKALASAHATLGQNPVEALDRGYMVFGPGPSGGPHVRVLDYQGNILSQWFAYEERFRGGVNVASADVDGDGMVEIITAPMGDYAPLVRIFDRNGTLEYEFMAYSPNFRGGVNISAGDVDGDGVAEIITGAGNGGGPHVRVFNSKGAVKDQFMAYSPNFRGGVNISAGDVDGDGVAEIITGAGNGGGPHVRVFNSKGAVKDQFMAYSPNFRGGVRVAVGNVNNNNLFEIVTSPQVGGGPHVRIFNKSGNLVSQFFARDKNEQNGIDIAVGDVNGDGLEQIIIAPGAGLAPEVRIFNWLGNQQSSLEVYSNNFRGGVVVDILQ